MNKPTRRGRGTSGFTLMELLVVLVVIGLIAAVAIPQVMRMMGSAKSKAARIQLETVGQSLVQYQMDVGSFPTDTQGLIALWESPADEAGWAGPYVRREKQLDDPWGRRLIYRAVEDASNFELGTLGADGAEGGSGEDADLSYEQ